MRRLQNDERLRAIGMLQMGSTQQAVANMLRVSQSVICRLWNRYQQTQNVRDRPRSGRPRATTRVQDRYIRTQVLRNRAQTANQLAVNLQQATGIRVTPQTIRNRLHAAHLHARRPRVVPPLTPQHMANRRQWCMQRRLWGNRRWSRVMFSDESRFTLDFLDRRSRVWRRVNERHDNVNVTRHNRFGGGSVMVCV